MVAYIIGFILILIALIIIGLVLRKTIYDQVDKLEAWKMDIMNRNVSGELQRVKVLHLSGETQTKFESWKDTWDQILTIDLPDIEEYLFDAEESADRFKIPTAKRSLASVEQILKNTEATIEEMFKELDDLLDSEKQNQKLAEELQPQIKSLRNRLIQDLYAYGEAEKRFEAEINVQKERLDQFHLETDGGNYYEAREIINSIKIDLEDLKARIDAFPSIYRKCKIELPDQIEQLKNGIDQMKKDGYHIDYHNFNQELRNMEQQLEDYVHKMADTDDPSVFEFASTIEERIQEIYSILEQESKARAYVNKHLTNFKTLVSEMVDDFKLTDQEVLDLQKTYYLEDSDLELYANLEKWIHQLEHQYNQINQDLLEEKQTYSSLKDELEVSYQDLQKLKQSHEEFKEQIQMIRKDEMEAKEKIDQLKRQLFETNRKLQKSNLPGIPSHVWNQIDEAQEKTALVLNKLAEEPLDMGKVNHALEEATTSDQLLIEQTDKIIEQAYLIERIIQYGNRYRSQSPDLAAKLSEAEQMFREFRYTEALEIASESLEEIEPGVLRRLEIRDEVTS